MSFDPADFRRLLREAFAKEQNLDTALDVVERQLKQLLSTR